MRELDYISAVPISYRKDFGQFFTPPSVARLMAEWVMKDHPKSILDPAFGLGVFYEEVKRIESHEDVQFTAYEIDERILRHLDLGIDMTGLQIINKDYLEVDVGTFEGVICNPPYMRFQKFLKRHDVLPKIEKQIGKKLVGYSNIASIFLVKSIKELSPDGRLAFIMPFEFFNTGYGEEVKRSLLDDHLLKQIIVFSNEKDIFPDATTTVCVLLCKNDGRKGSIKVTRVRSNEEIEAISDISDFYQLEMKPSDLPCNKKWTPIILSSFSKWEPPTGFCRLSLYGGFMRGIATGANDFFALRKSRIEELNIDGNNLCKCITKSHQIKKPVFTECGFSELYNSDKPVHCLDVRDHEKKEIRDYIEQGEKSGYHKRYLTRTKNPWYKIESRRPAPILFGVFSRGRLKVIRNLTGVINFTCFHSFYPNMFGEQVIDKLFVYLLSDRGQEIIKANKRSYGDNLDKFEPGDLNESLCPSQSQFALVDDKEARQVIETAKTDEGLAIEASNQLIQRILDHQEASAPEEGVRHTSKPMVSVIAR